MDERISLASRDKGTVAQHLARYEFASRFAKGKRVADAACGTGYGSGFFLKAGAVSYSGIDISPEAIEECQAKYTTRNVNFFRHSILELSQLGKFDLIVSFETIEHTTEYERFLQEVKLSLTRGANFIVSSPLRQHGDFSDSPENPFHTQEWTQKEFHDLLSGFFRIKDIYFQYGHRHPYLMGGAALVRRFWKLAAPYAFAEVERYPVVKSASDIPTIIPVKPIAVIAVCESN